MSILVRDSFTELESYKALNTHFQTCQALHMRRLFSIDAKRQFKMSLQFDWLLLDYSKNRVTDQTMGLLFDLARESKLSESIESLFASKASLTESSGAAAHHLALRCNHDESASHESAIFQHIQHVLQRMRALTECFHSREYKGFSGQSITDVVHISVGNIGVAPKALCKALTSYQQASAPTLHFISGIDGVELQNTLSALTPEKTVFIISSKSFHSAETQAHARTAKQWVQQAAGQQDISAHFIAITANPSAAQAFGVADQNILKLWDWLDSRYAIWSSLGFPLMLSIGARHFDDFLSGGRAMDHHVRHEPFEQNMPVIMALLGIWYSNFFGAEIQAILPYDHHLTDFPRCIEQIDMQSCARTYDNNQQAIDYATAPIVWSGYGMHNEHAFYQLLHRGRRVIPADFIVSARTHSMYQEQHDNLFANAIAQSELLMRGRTLNETLQDMEAQGAHYNPTRIPQSVLDGNNPSNLLLLQRLTPKSMGILLALYEHKTFIQSVLWNINPYDRWGVNEGDWLSSKIMQDLQMPGTATYHEASQNALLRHYKRLVYPPKPREKHHPD